MFLEGSIASHFVRAVQRTPDDCVTFLARRGSKLCTTYTAQQWRLAFRWDEAAGLCGGWVRRAQHPSAAANQT